MSQALYRKYRSRNLSEILGQPAVTNILERSLKQGEISHAYLLTGPHGVGKTSVARILAHAINDLPYDEESSHLDIIEIDAASNNGVEDIRDLRDKVHLAPTLAKYKVYIIDEVHMLSKPAFNALLKTLEEPPSHIVFILATTDADKLPATIISRVQRFNFRSIDRRDIIKHLSDIAKNEKIKIDAPALEMIADHAAGSFRDSISLLDQLKSSSDKDLTITPEEVGQALGTPPDQIITELLEVTKLGDITLIKKILNELEARGAPAATVAKRIVNKVYLSLETDPQFLTLLDQLLEVGLSSYPYLKLLVILAQSRASTDALSKQVKPSKPKVVAEAATPLKHTTLKLPREEKPADDKIEPSQTMPELEAKPQPKSLSDRLILPESIDWPAIVQSSRDISVALYSLLAKTDADYQDGKLTLYAGNAFNQKRISDPKQQAKLSQLLTAHQLDSIEIEILTGHKPPTDSKMAAISEIMGGGEEVLLNA